MASVETVTGAIEASELGRTLVHEHVIAASEATRFQFPHLYDREFERRRATEDLEAVKAHEVKTIFDPAALGLGRDVRFMREVSEETGVNIVPCTGIYRYSFLPQIFENRDENFLADALVHDIQQGIQETEIKAAFIKCAVDEPGLTMGVEKALRAGARASKGTGRPIMCHTHPATDRGREALDLFEEEGVDLSTVMLAHTGDTDDLDLIEKLLERGAWIGLDRYGLDIILSQEKRNATVAALCERGHTGRMFISQDSCSTIDWYPEELRAQLAPKWSMTLLFDEVLGELRALGVSDEQINQMLVENPREWISGRP